MTDIDIARLRLFHQHIATPAFNKPAEIVQFMGAMQAQDYAGAKWAVGMRLQKGGDAAVDEAMADGSIIRTHVLRPTWHFVAPADAGWMIELTAPRIKMFSAPYNRQAELDEATFKKSNDALAKGLDGKYLERVEVMAILNQAGVNTDGIRFIHLLMRAELDKVICSGPRQRKQFTYALFDDRVPVTPSLPKDEALAKLAERYFTSRSPATIQDFTWWSGLTATDAKSGLEVVKHGLVSAEVDGQTYWMPKNQPGMDSKTPIAHLLPAYDEFAVAYSDRRAIVNSKYLTQAKHVIFAPSIVVNNQVVGTWKRTVKKNEVEVILEPFGKLSKAQTAAVDAAVKRYRRFMKD